MRILLLSTLIILSGCSGLYHAKKSIRHAKKAITKGVTIPKDTITIHLTDTLVQTIHRNDTTFITKTVTNTITLEPIVEYKTRWQTKIEYKERIKYIKEETKQEKEKTKQVKTENKSSWLRWLLIGLGLGIIGTLYIRK